MLLRPDTSKEARELVHVVVRLRGNDSTVLVGMIVVGGTTDNSGNGVAAQTLLLDLAGMEPVGFPLA